MKMTVIGNIGTLMAGELAHRGHAVTVHSSKPCSWSRYAQLADPQDVFSLPTETVAPFLHIYHRS